MGRKARERRRRSLAAHKGWKTRKKRRYKTLPSGKKAFLQMNPLGLPWWLIIGGAALGIFLLTRKKAATATPGPVPGIDVQPAAMPAPVQQVVDPEDPPVVEINGYNYGRF
jgi:hypothetical protein